MLIHRIESHRNHKTTTWQNIRRSSLNQITDDGEEKKKEIKNNKIEPNGTIHGHLICRLAFVFFFCCVYYHICATEIQKKIKKYRNIFAKWILRYYYYCYQYL